MASDLRQKARDLLDAIIIHADRDIQIGIIEDALRREAGIPDPERKATFGQTSKAVTCRN